MQRLSTQKRSEFVFCTERGTPLDADNFRHREFPPALRRAGMRPIRFHHLRHTSIQTTLDRYEHLMPQVHQVEARKLDQLVFGEPTGRPRPRLVAVRAGRPPRGSKMGAATAAAGKHGSKMGAENTTGLAT